MCIGGIWTSYLEVKNSQPQFALSSELHTVQEHWVLLRYFFVCRFSWCSQKHIWVSTCIAWPLSLSQTSYLLLFHHTTQIIGMQFFKGRKGLFDIFQISSQTCWTLSKLKKKHQAFFFCCFCCHTLRVCTGWCWPASEMCVCAKCWGVSVTAAWYAPRWLSVLQQQTQRRGTEREPD